HERGEAAGVLDGHSDHPDAADARMAHQGVLHVDRGDPQAADLEHVVHPPDVDVGAVLAALVAVAGGEPVAAHAALGLLVLVPVERRTRATAGTEKNTVGRRSRSVCRIGPGFVGPVMSTDVAPDHSGNDSPLPSP